MRKSIQSIVGLLILSIILTVVGCASDLANHSSEPIPVTEEESRVVAENYVKNSPTFTFDGIEDTLKLVATNILAHPYSWEFVYQFQNSHPGYGDRSGLMLAQVITAHRARIVVQEGEVVSAVMDKKWDMMRQRML